MKTFSQLIEDAEERRLELLQRQREKMLANKEALKQRKQEADERRQQEREEREAQKRAKIQAQRDRQELENQLRQELQTEQVPFMGTNYSDYNRRIQSSQITRKLSRERHAQHEIEATARAQRSAREKRMAAISRR